MQLEQSQKERLQTIRTCIDLSAQRVQDLKARAANPDAAKQIRQAQNNVSQNGFNETHCLLFLFLFFYMIPLFFSPNPATNDADWVECGGSAAGSS